MTTYYVDSVHGSDSSNGTSSGSAFASLEKMSEIKLKAGDTILLAKGSVFDDTLVMTGSGKEGSPITITSYGEGENPIFSGAMGIHGSKSSYVNISNVSFVGTDGGAIYAGSVKGWVIDHVVVKDTGSVSGVGGMNFKSSSDITIKNSTFDGVTNDGIFIDGVKNLTITNNVMTNLTGKTADGIQVNNGANVVISDNTIDQRGTTSLKGGIITQYSEDVVVTGNTILGGSFGLGINGHHVLIDGNTVSGQTSAGWSAGILISGEEDVGDYTITNNTVTGANFGVAVTGLKAWKYARSDIDISDNTFTDIVTAALKVDKSSTGTFTDNTIISSASTLIKGEGLLGHYDITDNASLTHAQADAIHNPVETTPTAPTTPTVPVVETPQPEAPKAPVEVVTPTPTPTPAPTPTPTPTPTPAPTDSTKAPDKGVNVAPVGVIDRAAVDAAGHKLTGNVLTNDTDANGDTLSLRSVGTTKVGTTGAIDIDAKFGTLHIDATGAYSYTLHAGAAVELHGLSGSAAMDKFTYKMSDGTTQDSAQLIIDLSAFVTAHDHAVI